MKALYRDGRHTEALDTYQSWRRYLAEELGLEPSPALQGIETSICSMHCRSSECTLHRAGRSCPCQSPASSGASRR